MKRNTLVLILSVLVIVIALAHLFAMEFNLYFHVWWFDLVMHFLGGFWCGLFALDRFRKTWLKRGLKPGIGRVISAGLLGAFVFGILWEIYEYTFGFTFTSKSSYVVDTVLDLIMDSAGGILAGATLVGSFKKQLL